MLGITIVTPSFNQAPFLEQCIDSILSQDYPDLEYIIMDGGSTDGSVDIIKKYQRHLTYWQSRPDGGQYQAINEGFSRSANPVMGWLNADDMLHRGGLAVVGELFSSFTEVEFLTGKRVGFDLKGDIASFGHIDETWCHDLLLDKDRIRKETLFVMQEATFWRRSLWEKAGGSLDTSLSLAADFELWLRMSRHAALHTVNALTGGFRCYSMEQRCNKNRDEYVAQCCQAIDREIALNLPPAPHRSTPPPLIDYPLRQKPARFDILTQSELPKISIVTPSFNQKQYLEECIDSVLSQNYPNLEYIVMDGGSTDGSAEIIAKYSKHLNYWHSRRDFGQYHAVQMGFWISTGEIMAWLNSDDKYHPGALWLVADAFGAFPELRWVTGSPTLWDKDGKISAFAAAPPVYSREKYLKGEVNLPYIQQESTFWRRTLWDEAGGTLDPSFPLAADMELWAHFFRHARLHTLNASLGGFRSHPGEGQRSEAASEQYAQEAERIVARERAYFAGLPEEKLLAPPEPLQVAQVVARAGSRLQPERFGFFIYSRRTHFPFFQEYDQELFGRRIDPARCDIPEYQALLLYAFLRQNLPKRARILVLGEGCEAIIDAAHRDYEFWQLCLPQAFSSRLQQSRCRLVAGEIDSAGLELPERYFDLAIGITAAEPVTPEPSLERSCRNLTGTLKEEAWSLHCFEVLYNHGTYCKSPLLDGFCTGVPAGTTFVPFEQVSLDPSTLAVGSVTEGIRFSYQVFWRNGSASASAETVAQAPSPSFPHPRRLHLGEGTAAFGWEKICCTPGVLSQLSGLADRSIAEIYACRLLDRLAAETDPLLVVEELYRVLRNFGTLYLSVTDLDLLARHLLDKEELPFEDRLSVLRKLAAGGVGLNEESLRHYLQQAGFSLATRVDRFPMFAQEEEVACGEQPVTLRLMARKLPRNYRVVKVLSKLPAGSY
ncbi:glycosyltransferase family 2 protein [Citrifermentans bremense]|uniref:glycosyltransferase family 2 protein n=1 Tax=Citrifermentans bremense TaxID=60035 RepID=UPI0004180290|nr:glycosyltransferase family 2 protein [Citrifermentans bremense]